MEYRMNLGAWNSVFAVPCELTDKHLKLAGAAQLKVILWFLRHAGEGKTVEDIGSALSMPAADVRDCMSYWIETGLIRIEEGVIEPMPLQQETVVESTEEKEEVKPEPQPEQESVPEKKKKSVISRPEKPDAAYLSRRIAEDEGVAYLMQTADEIFGRLTSNSDKATLLMINESYGLPVEVIIMLLQYVAGIGKCNIYYIEKTAVNWAEEEITSLERAEKKIQLMTIGRSAVMTVQRIFGLESHSPTEKETEYADKWINVWKFSEEMLRKAYEVCIDAKGKYIIKYIDSVLGRWYNNGITTPEMVEMDQSKGKAKPKAKYDAAYDISEYESRSVVD